MSMEKRYHVKILRNFLLSIRINFSLDTLAPASPAYDYFRSCLMRTYQNANQQTVRFNFHQLPSDFPQLFFPTSISQLFLYERSKELVSLVPLMYSM